MKFENPAALWGLASLILLILFSLWRQASAKVVVPSLLLWKKIPERNPPVRALRRPRWRLELLLQALAVSAAVGALAKPYKETDEPKPRRVALVFDTSARMRAGDRLAKMKKHASQLIQDQLRKDVVTCYDAAPAPRSFKSPDDTHGADGHVDLAPLIAAARANSDLVILYSDHEVEGTLPALFGAPADNAGIVAFSVSDDEAFIRIVNHGAPRKIPILLKTDSAEFRDTIPAGQLTWAHKADYSKAAFLRVAIEPADSFPLDDAVEATRLVGATSLVSLNGLYNEGLVRVFRSMPGVSVMNGELPARVAVGYDRDPGPGDVRVWLYTPKANLAGALKVEKHPLTADLEARVNELSGLTWGEVPALGKPLIRVGDKVAAALQGKELHVCVDVNQWQKGLKSFPIFWVNVVDFAQGAASGLTVVHGGPKANLLDERESDTAGKSQELSLPPATAARNLVRADLSGGAAWSALFFLVLAWLLQLRPD